MNIGVFPFNIYKKKLLSSDINFLIIDKIAHIEKPKNKTIHLLTCDAFEFFLRIDLLEFINDFSRDQ